MKEVWKDIPNYEGLYQINNFGNIKSLYNYRGKNNILKPRIKRGYYTIGLRKDGKRKWIGIHRLLADTFIPNPNNYPVVNHKDENKLNNNLDNLEWCTVSYNNSYGTRLERVKSKVAKTIMQYDLKGNFIKEYTSLMDASRELKFSAANISNCANGKFKQANGYIWKYKKGSDA